MRIYIVGSLNMDLVIAAPYIPRGGETVEGDSFMTNPGGKGANQAVAVAKLGGDAHMVGCVGRAFGNELLSALCGSGVHTEHVRKDAADSSGIAVIVVSEGDNRIILDRGANGAVDEALADEALRDASAGDYLIVQLEIARGVVEYVLKRAKERGMITVLNPAPAAELSPAAFANCDYFIPNQSEAEFYTGIYPKDEAGARRCAAKLAEMGVKNVVVTMGEEGSVGICGGAFYRAPAVRAKAVDTTAAGDTFVGAFVTRLSEGADPGEAMRFASRAAAVTVTRRGAQQAIPTRREAERFVGERGTGA